MKILVLIGTVLAMAGCGANGAPLRPTASTNVSVGTHGVSAGTNLGVSNGIVSLGIGQSIYRN
jgi:hypothetical protein